MEAKQECLGTFFAWPVEGGRAGWPNSGGSSFDLYTYGVVVVRCGVVHNKTPWRQSSAGFRGALNFCYQSYKQYMHIIERL